MSRELRNKKFFEIVERHKKIKAEGFAGVLPSGKLVDRREFPNAIPLEESLLKQEQV